ncbi:MAG: GntR family transcriptional regulator [Candidatus Brocadiia bacterium]
MVSGRDVMSERGTRIDEIVSMLRDRIVSGQFPPGARFPKRTELIEEFEASNGTIQAAVDRLIEEGFLEATRGQGTFVSESVPHLKRHGLVMPMQPHSERDIYSQFYTALREAAKSVAAEQQLQIVCYDSIDFGREGETRQNLMEDVESRRVAGLVFVDCPDVENFFRNESLPRVAVAASSPRPAVPSVYVDAQNFMEKALKYLVENGRSAVAVLHARSGQGGRRRFEHLAHELDLEVRPYWKYRVDPRDGDALATYVHLLMSGKEDRPDGLVIADDNLVTMATMGVGASGVKVPDELQVVAATNFPAAPEAQVPVQRLGFDAEELLRLCLNRISAIREGEPMEQSRFLPATFEQELRGANAINSA